MKSFEKLKTLVASLEEDAQKTDKGNFAASTRLREGMLELKEICKEVRVEARQICTLKERSK
jgi:hypothetical protein